jgi:DNA polymerase-3 subunit beta
MKLTIERASLLRALSHVQNVVERRNAIPVLSNVLIEAGRGRLRLCATDMDIAVVDLVDAAVQKEGATTAPVHTLYDIVRKLPEGAQVEISQAGDSGQLTLRAGRSHFTLSCLPREDFPNFADGDLPHRYELAAEELRTIIDRTRFAISTEETRYYLNGIFFHAAEAHGVKLLRAVATDGHRLARVEIPLPEGAEGIPGVIIPRKTIGELRRLLEEGNEPVKISLSDTRIRFGFDKLVLTSKLIDGTFPDYQRVIPTGNDKILQVNRKHFAEAVDRVSTISTEKSRSIKLGLASGSVTLQATSPDAGSANEEIEASYSGTAIEIGFNSRYLLDIALQIEGDTAEFQLADAGAPTIIRDTADATALYVLMPMRV